MRSISIAYDWLINAMKVLAGAIVVLIFVLISLDVLLPLLGEILAVVGYPVRILAWDGTLGVVEYGLLWFTVLAAPWLARTKSHVFIDAINEFISPKVQRVTSKVAYLIVISGALLLTWFTSNLFLEAYMDEVTDERSIELMLWWIYAPMPLSFAMVAIEFIRFLLGIDDMFGSRSDVKEGM
ncbi:MAG: TRAP transporter small permease [Rickettsiales bacterium]